MEIMLFVFAIGYLVIVLIGVIVALIWSIRRRLGFLKTAGVVLATLLVIYVIPFGDHTLGEIKKHQLCKEHGGTKIFQVVEGVEGFMWAGVGGQGNPPHTTYGYPFTEAIDSSGRINRYTRRSDGSIENHIVNESQARYVARLELEKWFGPDHFVSKFTIVDVRDNKVLAAHAKVGYQGGWLGFGSLNCPLDRFDELTLVQQVLKSGRFKE